jgi:hypothetical protein
MFKEIQCVTNFILFYISLNLKGNAKALTLNQGITFKKHLEEILIKEYKTLWNENYPLIGSFYRVLSMTHNIDPLIWFAWNKINRSKKDLQTGLKDITLYVNPFEVTVKLNKYYPSLTIYSKQNNIMFDVVFPITQTNPNDNNHRKKLSFRKYIQTILTSMSF